MRILIELQCLSSAAGRHVRMQACILSNEMEEADNELYDDLVDGLSDSQSAMRSLHMLLQLRPQRRANLLCERRTKSPGFESLLNIAVQMEILTEESAQIYSTCITTLLRIE